MRTPATNFLASVGWADKKQKIPMRPDHAFRIGSVTKTFTGIISAQLHVEGKLNTDALMTNYLPVSITRHFPNSERITLRQMTRHTSGIRDFNDSVAYMLNRRLFSRRGDWPPMRDLSYAYDKPARFSPGEGWDYSNSNFLMLGLMIDQVTGHHHSVEIRQRILEPLNLTNTYYELSEPARGELAHGYERHFGFWEDATGWTPVVGGSSGMVSTVTDLATFVRAVAGTNSFLDEPTRKLLKSQIRKGNADQPWYPVSGYDFGVSVNVPAENDVPFFFGHAGGTSGYLCFAWHEPQHDITIAFFGSSSLVDAFHQRRNYEFQHLLEKALFELTIEEMRHATDAAVKAKVEQILSVSDSLKCGSLNRPL
ncbi:MAG: beta-lactamase family protein [Verrucomicrobia subdivision 3 bacterium]|nr:beta-lactamase family protein [Limisphaerales bacterium]